MRHVLDALRGTCPLELLWSSWERPRWSLLGKSLPFALLTNESAVEKSLRTAEGNQLQWRIQSLNTVKRSLPFLPSLY